MSAGSDDGREAEARRRSAYASLTHVRDLVRILRAMPQDSFVFWPEKDGGLTHVVGASVDVRAVPMASAGEAYGDGMERKVVRIQPGIVILHKGYGTTVRNLESVYREVPR